MDRLNQNRSDLPYHAVAAPSYGMSGADFQNKLKAVLARSSDGWARDFGGLVDQLPEVKLADRPQAATKLIAHTYLLGFEEQMAILVDIIHVIDQSIENHSPAVKESIALNLEHEIATATDLSCAPAANVVPLYSMMMQFAQIHGLNDFATALTLRLVARISTAPLHHKNAEFNAGILMIPQCPADLQRLFVVELIKLLPQALDEKIDALERMKEEATGLAHEVVIPINQKLFQARLAHAAIENHS